MSCECGCGRLVKVGRRFVNHHYPMPSGWHHTKEWKQQNSLRNKGNKYALGHKHTEEWKRGASIRHKGNRYNLGRVQTDESNKKRSEALKGRPSPMRGGTQSEESNRKRSETLKGRISQMRGKYQPESAKRKIGQASRGNQYALGSKRTLETKQKMSDVQRRLWADPIWHKEQQSRMARGNRLARPNKVETKLLELLDYLHPGDWKYVGDGSLIIAGKNPDFVNVNGRKLIMELFGDHWHRNDIPAKRAAIFRPFGYRTLVVWERELKNRPVLIGRINKFTQREV